MNTAEDTYTIDDAHRLGERFDSIDLGPGERAALDALITFASRRPSELAGFENSRNTHSYGLVLSEILFDD